MFTFCSTANVLRSAFQIPSLLTYQQLTIAADSPPGFAILFTRKKAPRFDSEEHRGRTELSKNIKMAQWTVISRCVLFLLNVVLMLAALGVIGVGFWMRYDASFDADLKNVLYRNDDPKRLEDAKRALRVWITVVFWSSIGLSIGAAIITLFGMISSVSVKHRGFIITYLVLITLLALLQIGGVVAILIQRNALHNDTDELIDTMYITNSVADLRIIQDTYSCCGTTNGVYNAFYCNSVSTKPYCDDAMFESLDSTLMISVIVVLAIVSLEFIAIVLSVALFISIRNYYKYRYEPNEVTRF